MQLFSATIFVWGWLEISDKQSLCCYNVYGYTFLQISRNDPFLSFNQVKQHDTREPMFDVLHSKYSSDTKFPLGIPKSWRIGIRHESGTFCIGNLVFCQLIPYQERVCLCVLRQTSVHQTVFRSRGRHDFVSRFTRTRGWGNPGELMLAFIIWKRKSSLTDHWLVDTGKYNRSTRKATHSFQMLSRENSKKIRVLGKRAFRF